MEIEIQISMEKLVSALRRTVVEGILEGPPIAQLIAPFSAPYPTIIDSPVPCVIYSVALGDVNLANDSSTDTNIFFPPWDSGVSNDIEAPQLTGSIDLLIPYISETQLRLNGHQPATEGQLLDVAVRVELILPQPTITDTSVQINPIISSLSLVALATTASPLVFDLASAPTSIQPLLMAINQPSVLGMLRPSPFQLNLSGLLEIAGEGAAIRNSGMVVVDDALTIRSQVEIGNGFFFPGVSPIIQRSTVERWEQFFSGDTILPSLPADQSLAIYISKELIISRIEQVVISEVNGRDTMRFTGDGFPNSTWTVIPTPNALDGCSPGGEASIKTTFEVTMIDVCPPADIDIDVEVTIDVQMQMTDDLKFRVELTVSFDLDNGDVFRCGLVNATIASFAGLTIGGAVGGWVGAVIGAVVLGVGAGIGTTVAAYNQDFPNISDDDLQAIEGRDNAYFLEEPLSVPGASALGQLTIGQLVPCVNGFIIEGQVESTEFTQFNRLVGPGSDLEWEWIRREAYRGVIPDPVYYASLRFRFPNPESDMQTILWSSDIRSPSPFVSNTSAEIRSVPSVGNGLYFRIMMNEAEARALIERDVSESLEFELRSNSGARYMLLPAITSLSIEELDNQHEQDAEEQERVEDLLDNFRDDFMVLRDMVGGVPEEPPSALDLFPGLVFWGIRNQHPIPDSIQVGLYSGNNLENRHKLVSNPAGGFATQLWAVGDEKTMPIAIAVDGFKVADLQVIAERFAPKFSLDLDFVPSSQALFRHSGSTYLELRSAKKVVVYKVSENSAPRVVARPAIRREILTTSGNFNQNVPRIESNSRTKKPNRGAIKKDDQIVLSTISGIHVERRNNLAVLIDSKRSLMFVYTTDPSLARITKTR